MSTKKLLFSFRTKTFVRNQQKKLELILKNFYIKLINHLYVVVIDMMTMLNFKYFPLISSFFIYNKNPFPQKNFVLFFCVNIFIVVEQKISEKNHDLITTTDDSILMNFPVEIPLNEWWAKGTKGKTTSFFTVTNTDAEFVAHGKYVRRIFCISFTQPSHVVVWHWENILSLYW